MSPVLPMLLGLLVFARATRRERDDGGRPLDWDPAEHPAITLPARVSGEIDLGLPRIDFWLERRGEIGAEAIAGVTWPNGHYSEVREEFVGFDPFAAAGLLIAGDEIGRTSTDKLSPELSAHRIRLSWRSLEDAKKKPRGWKYDASKAVMEKWWQSIGRSKRGDYKLRYAALMDNVPASHNANDRARNKWWISIGKKKRGKLKDPYETTFWEGAGNIAKAVAEPLATYVLPQALNLVVPGSGVAVTAAITAAKLAAGAAKGKVNPKALVNAALSAAGNPDTAKVAAAVQQITPKVVATVKAAKSKKAANVAKAKTVASVAKVLKSPATQRALEKVGVPRAQTKKAAAMFGAIKSAAASLALAKQGDAKGAAAHKRAAEALASAASVPSTLVQEGGRKLFYLALTPGD